ncbi:MAG: hypothetical protein HYX42_18725, partial [Polaromonas sp.]|nr:hypothetical protein [Polaromonas sp.]
DVIDAGAGDDQVIASWGDDLVDGGEGDDQISGMAGADILEGGQGNDNIDGDGTVKAGYLNTVDGASHGDDFIDGGDGADQLWGDQEAARLAGSAATDPAAWGNDELDGEEGNDTLVGGGKDDVLYGGAGNDLLMGDESSIALDASANGADHLDGEDARGVAIDSIAASACRLGSTGRFKNEKWRRRAEKRASQRRLGHQKEKSAHAYSARLADRKRPGRRMDSAPLCRASQITDVGRSST